MYISLFFDYLAYTCQINHCVKSVRLRSYSGPHFLAFGRKKERYSASLLIQSECGKIRTRLTPNKDTFYQVNVEQKSNHHFQLINLLNFLEISLLLVIKSSPILPLPYKRYQIQNFTLSGRNARKVVRKNLWLFCFYLSIIKYRVHL